MKIDITKAEVKKGLLRKKIYHRISINWSVSEAEKRIVNTKYDEIGNMVVIDPREFSSDSIALRVGHFQGDGHFEFDFSTLDDANIFQEELRGELDRLKKFFDQYGAKPEDRSVDLRSDSERFEAAKFIWERSISGQGTGEEREDAWAALSKLVDERIPIPKLYELVANVFLNVNGLESSANILELLKTAHEFCGDDREAQERIESQLLVLGKMCFDEGLKEASFAAYSQALNYWVSAGNLIGQDAPLPHRIGFCIMRVVSKEALENGDNKMGVVLLELCEKSGIDINTEIDLSDAKSGN